jgi:hypothetical protein
VFQKFIRVSVSINNQRFKKAVFECKRLWLELEIKHHYSSKESINTEHYNLNIDILKNIVPNISFEIWINFKRETDEIANHKFEQKRHQQNWKIRRIIQQRNMHHSLNRTLQLYVDKNNKLQNTSMISPSMNPVNSSVKKN